MSALDKPDSASKPSRIWQSAPGSIYSDSFLIGNGRLGAGINGAAQSESIPVNEDSFWSGPALDRVNEDALAYMPEVQSLIFNQRPGEASDRASYSYVGTPVSTRHYDVLGSLQLTMNHTSTVEDYERWLDVGDGTSGIYYKAGNATYTREYIASNPANIIAIRIAADTPGVVDFTVHMSRNPKGSLNRFEDYSKKAGSDTVILGGGDASANSIAFSSGAKVISRGGTVKTIGDTIFCNGADEAWIYFTSWTTFRKKDPRSAVLADLAAVSDLKYVEVREKHVQDYQALAGRVSLNLGTSSADQKAKNTVDRMSALATKFDPELVALYFQLGRYLLITSSRNGTLPPNLQGIWNNVLDPQWGSKYTIK